ncbi:MAG TPA: pyruvate synthase [Acholeplasmataceae bacterium]|jgi:pyruvate ferredoxin oxidoreductase alpha subunit|nr:pyruvate synthase [Acholeplasmataceae bacterium]
MIEQKMVFENGNELAAYAAKQINYHIMGYYPITPSTGIVEQLDLMKSEGLHDIVLIEAEGEHSAAGLCYGAATAGGRVLNATSAQGLLYSLEQLPVQSGTRFPMVLNVATRAISGPLSIKGDHSDLMFALNTGWIILFANSPQMVYDLNICAIKIAEANKLPVIVAYDGFFTSHQKRNVEVFAYDEDVQKFIGKYDPIYTSIDCEHPVAIGTYMNEEDYINNKYQLRLALLEAKNKINEIFNEYHELTGRLYKSYMSYKIENADTIIFALGSTYFTLIEAIDNLGRDNVGALCLNVLRPFPKEELFNAIKNCKNLIILERQDSFGGESGNMSFEIKAMLQEYKSTINVITRVYGLSGKELFMEDVTNILNDDYDTMPKFDYYGVYKGDGSEDLKQYFKPVNKDNTCFDLTKVEIVEKDGVKELKVTGGRLNETTRIPKRLAPGHSACPGCGIFVNVNLLLRGIEGNVVLLFQTGCGYVTTTSYPVHSFKVPFVHNLFQNGAATLSGIVEMFEERKRRGEIPDEKITFIMVTGDGGLDIGFGSAIGAAIRNHGMIILEYDNGGYMNTGYQLSYTTPKGASSSTSHVGKFQYGKTFYHKDTAQIMAATNIPYVATAAESHPADFIKKAASAQYYANKGEMAYIKCLSACPLNWRDNPATEAKVIKQAVDTCYFPLYTVVEGKTKISYFPKEKKPVIEWFKMMGRTKHLAKPEYKEIVEDIQNEVDRRWKVLVEKHNHPYL